MQMPDVGCVLFDRLLHCRYLGLSGGRLRKINLPQFPLQVRVLIKVPGWIPIPVSTVSSTGSAVLQQLLNASVPRFLRELERDYNRWATGDESRKPLGDGNI